MKSKLRALFVHDHRFFTTSSGEVYTAGQLPYNVWQRYLKFFDELIVAARSSPNEHESFAKLNLSSGENVSFALMPDLANPWRMIRNRYFVVKKLKEQIQAVDAVVARTSLLGRLAVPIAIQLKKPWAVEVVGCAWDAYWNYGSIKGKLYAPFSWLGQRRMLKQAEFAIYVTQQFLQRRYPSKGNNTGVSDVDILINGKAGLDHRLRRVQNPGIPFVFGLIGSLNSKYKGIQTALAALESVSKQFPEFELRILGGGDASNWRQLAASHGLANKVKFVGTLPAGDPVLSWLDDVDVYLQPSFTEGLPRSLVEAMSRGCPSIGSTAGGIPELLAPEVLHMPGKTDQLRHLIEKSLDKKWREQQAKRNFEKASLYSKDRLDSKRDEFWKLFASHVRRHQGGLF